MPSLKSIAPAVRPAAPPLVHTLAQTERTRGAAWQKTRERVMQRDKGVCRCEDCRTLGRLRPAHQVDHIVPLDFGGSDDDANLQAINRECHKVKSRREQAQRALNALRSGRPPAHGDNPLGQGPSNP